MSRISAPVAAAAILAIVGSSVAVRVSAEPSSDAAPDSARVLTEVQVIAKRLDEARNGLMPETGSSVYRLDAADIKNLPLGDSTPLNQVLLQAPGVVQDSYGQLHVRGDHANLQYRINDIVIPEAIALFGQSLNPRFAEQISLLSGALPAQYGYRTAGVVDMHTKGAELGTGGRLSVLGGSHNHREVSGEVYDSGGPFTAYLTGTYLENNLGIENPIPTTNAIHDKTQQESAFAYLSYVVSPTSRLSLMLGAANNNFQIPNNPGQAPAFFPPGVTVPDSAQLDANQHESNRFAILAFQSSIGDTFNYQIAVHDRFTDVHYKPDPLGDLNYNGLAGNILRRNNVYGLQSDASLKANDAHTFRFGVNYSRESARSEATSVVYPVDDTGNPIYTPLTIVDNNAQPGTLWGVYAQDEWQPVQHLTINYGARFDKVQSVVDEQQLSPRLGLVYELTSGTTFHAGYARYFTTPPTEKITTETISLFAGTTNAPELTADSPVRSERSHYYDVGLLQKVSSAVTVGLDAFYRRVSQLQDEGQFGAALVFAPFNYAEGKVYGVELSTSYREDGTVAYANVTYESAKGRQVASGQFNFGQDELDYIATHWVDLDHEQTWTGSAGLSHTWGETTISGDALFGSGLRAGFANTDHLPSYLQLNLAARHSFDLGGFGRLDASVSLLNALDRVFELRDGSGIGVGAPQWGIRRTIYVGLSKPFG